MNDQETAARVNNLSRRVKMLSGKLEENAAVSKKNRLLSWGQLIEQYTDPKQLVETFKNQFDKDYRFSILRTAVVSSVLGVAAIGAAVTGALPLAAGAVAGIGLTAYSMVQDQQKHDRELPELLNKYETLMSDLRNISHEYNDIQRFTKSKELSSELEQSIRYLDEQVLELIDSPNRALTALHDKPKEKTRPLADLFQTSVSEKDIALKSSEMIPKSEVPVRRNPFRQGGLGI